MFVEKYEGDTMHRKLRVGVIDLTTKSSPRTLHSRVMLANLSSIMPQVIAAWCEEEGHAVKFVCFTGIEDLVKELSDNMDIIFIGAFTHAAQLAYALSNLFRTKGVVTVLGGPHARCYPQDAQQYFDYVLGFTDKAVIRDILQDCSAHRPIGIQMGTNQQPTNLPGVRARWKFIKQTLQKTPFLKMVPMIGSMGCPYTCSFCIDSVIPYQPLNFDVIKEDLRFLLGQFKRPCVIWHDPNFGVRFDDYMDTIEDAIPPDSIDFIAESSLSLLSEPHLKRLKRNGFKAMLPGIESWYDLGNKSKTGKTKGIEKVKQISEHVNMLLEYIPFVQTNLIFGLDIDEGREPFELTKRFVDMTPGALPTYLLLSAYGQAAPVNLEYQRDNRVLPIPFHFLDSCTMNVKPKNYSWTEFYDNMIDLTKHTFSWRAIGNRYKANTEMIPKWMNVLRGASPERHRRKHFREISKRLNTDSQFRAYFEQEETEIPQFYVDRIRKDLDPLWEWLPTEALYHDPNAYLRSEKNESFTLLN